MPLVNVRADYYRDTIWATTPRGLEAHHDQMVQLTEFMCILLTISNNSFTGLNSQFSKPAMKEKVFGRILNYP